MAIFQLTAIDNIIDIFSVMAITPSASFEESSTQHFGVRGNVLWKDYVWGMARGERSHCAVWDDGWAELSWFCGHGEG